MITVEVLGPLRVVDATGGDVTPRGALQCRLLAALVLRRGRVVTADQLVDDLWPDGIGGTAGALHNHVSRLRSHVPAARIERRGQGYALVLDDETVDAHRFERGVSDAAAARPTDPARALAVLDDALATWRGDPYADLVEVDDGRIEIERLVEIRARAIEERFAALLDLGRVEEATADLEAFVAREPLRERPRDLLMTALAAVGRRAEALRVYDAYRKVLAGELGVDPSPALRDRHEALLAADREVDDPAPVPPTRAGPLARHALPPRSVSSLVGREQLLDRVAADLGRRRIVTLVGPGGVGKTRLATELGHRLAGRFADGVRFCDLTAASDEDVVATLAAVVGVEQRVGVDLLDRVGEVLRHDDGLVVLDNCEHVLERAATVAEHLVGTTEGLVVLATSRERLAVDGEQLCPVDPLDATGGASPAVELFVDRARAVDPDFELDSATTATVEALCRRLDGLPLAIELAATRLRSLTLDEVAHGLGESSAVLRGGRRTIARHRSLEAALRWSYDLLDEDERRALGAAAVFASPFDAADVAAVLAIDVAAARELLATLVERSLVRRADGRFALLETVRQFTREQHDEASTADAARRHLARIVERAEAARVALHTAEDAAPLDEVRRLVPDLRQALGVALAERDADAALRLVLAVRDPAFSAMLPELMLWGEAAAALGADAGHPLAAEGYGVAALGAWKIGDLDRMRPLVVAALDAGGDVDRYEVVGALALEDLAMGRMADAVCHFRRALATPEATGEPVRLAENGAALAVSAAYAHDPAADDIVRWLLDDVEPTGGAVVSAWCWYAAGECLLGTDPAGARSWLERAVGASRVGGASFVEGVAGASLASLDVREGRTTAAVAAYEWLLPLWLRAGVRSPFWTMLRTVTELACCEGLDESAARLLGAVTAPDAGHEVVGDDEELLRSLRATLDDRLGAERAAALVEEGRGLGDAAAAAEATAALARIR
ncbi:MAG: BTAD domain-containing putative transcriptional regulator [Actinomycetota bacterium]|nr:BTAD domain-containing putative transcriptional regulator [Actinomycetota bacterium]